MRCVQRNRVPFSPRNSTLYKWAFSCYNQVAGRGRNGVSTRRSGRKEMREVIHPPSCPVPPRSSDLRGFFLLARPLACPTIDKTARHDAHAGRSALLQSGFGEHVLAHAAQGALEIVGQILKQGAGGNAVLRAAQFLVVLPAASVANILRHGVYLHYL